MKPDGEGFVLSTGRTFYANQLILGLSPTSDEIYEGYDGTVEASRERWGRSPDEVDEGEEPPFTPAERQEIAGYMIELWRAWGAK